MLIKIDDKRGVELSMYQDNYYLTSMYGDKPNWCQMAKGFNKFSEKASPVRIAIGSKSQAVQLLLDALLEITGRVYSPDWES